jgi:DNA polymerase III subunit gamma/tau
MAGDVSSAGGGRSGRAGTSGRGTGASAKQPKRPDRRDRPDGNKSSDRSDRSDHSDRTEVPQAPLALYRRYRPASFAEVKGQDHVTEPLRQALRSGRVHHAYLFSGPRGCGKTSSARILARSLNCELGPTPDPCGKCASCVALGPAGAGSIDVIEIDAASHGGIDDARDLRERAFYSPVAARYKIYIIDEAHMVTGGGFNALLKLVEEPPPHLKFVFATTEPEKVIPTIRSRTHHYPFRLVPPAILRELLEEILAAEKVTYEPAVLPVVIRAGAGSARDSLSVLDQLIAGADESGLRYDRAIALLGYTDDALLDEMADALARGDGASTFLAIDHVVEAGHDPRRFAMDLLDRLRDLIVLAAVPDAGTSGLLDAPEDQLERMRKQAEGFGQERLARSAETISAGLVEMRGATSPRLLLELMCAQVLLPAEPDRKSAARASQGLASPVTAGADELAARVERLERQLAAGARPSAGGVRPTPGPDAGRPAATSRQQERGSTPPGRPLPGANPRGSPQPGGAAGQPAPVATGVDADVLRNRWPDVLNAVREVRRTAWILLSNYASIDSVEGNILNLAFDTEGNAKGFASTGSDGYLADVLQTMFGVRLVIRATARPAGPRGGSAAIPRRPQDQPGSPSPRTGPDPEPAARRADSTSGAAERPTSQATAAIGKAAAQQGGDRAAREPTARRGARPSAPSSRSAESDPPDDPRPHTDATPDGAEDLTGSDLVMRELGGRVIDEIGEG